MSLTSNLDVLQAIVAELGDQRYNAILALSLVSKDLRDFIAPLLFRHVENRRSGREPIGEVWPIALWKYIVVDVYDRQTSTYMSVVENINFGPLAPALSQLPSLKHVCFELEAPPSHLLLSAVASAPNVDTLEFTNARFDGPLPTKLFARMKLTSLTIAIGLRSKDTIIHVDEEEKNVENLLTVLAEKLVHLEISGDLVSFQTLKNLHWPNLLTLRYTDHVPFGDILPIPVVLSNMPHLLTLGYNFAASVRWYKPAFIFCSKDLHPSTSLSATHPGLQIVTVSNIYTEDGLFEQLPAGLRVLRILALRDDLEVGESSNMPYYPYFPITNTDALKIIEKASELCHLVELAITLQDCPSPDLITAVALSCPGLRVVELTQGSYDKNVNHSPYTTESLARPLKQLKFLHDLRLTIWFGPQSAGFRSHQTKYEIWSQINIAAQVFAETLPGLTSISFSFTNFRRYDGTRHPICWYHLAVHDGVDFRPPVTKFGRYLEYYSHSRSPSRWV